MRCLPLVAFAPASDFMKFLEFRPASGCAHSSTWVILSDWAQPPPLRPASFRCWINHPGEMSRLEDDFCRKVPSAFNPSLILAESPGFKEKLVRSPNGVLPGHFCWDGHWHVWPGPMPSRKEKPQSCLCEEKSSHFIQIERLPTPESQKVGGKPESKNLNRRSALFQLIPIPALVSLRSR